MQIQAKVKKPHSETTNEDVGKYIKYALVHVPFNSI